MAGASNHFALLESDDPGDTRLDNKNPQQPAANLAQELFGRAYPSARRVIRSRERQQSGAGPANARAKDGQQYGWAFGLPENFGLGSSGFGYFGFPKILPEISLKEEELENSGSGSGLPGLPEFLTLHYQIPPACVAGDLPPAAAAALPARGGVGAPGLAAAATEGLKPHPPPPPAGCESRERKLGARSGGRKLLASYSGGERERIGERRRDGGGG